MVLTALHTFPTEHELDPFSRTPSSANSPSPFYFPISYALYTVLREKTKKGLSSLESETIPVYFSLESNSISRREKYRIQLFNEYKRTTWRINLTTDQINKSTRADASVLSEINKK